MNVTPPPRVASAGASHLAPPTTSGPRDLPKKPVASDIAKSSAVDVGAFIKLGDHLVPEMLPMLKEHLDDPDTTIRRRALDYSHAIEERLQIPPHSGALGSQTMTGLALFEQWPMFSFWEEARREAVSLLDQRAPLDQRLEIVLLIVHLWSHQCELGSEMYDDMVAKGPTPDVLEAKKC